MMQAHKDEVQELRRRHLASTIELQYQQLRSLHEMRIDHLNKQHASEWDNQLTYGKKAERELRKKHVLELKEHPKSLKVRLAASAAHHLLHKPHHFTIHHPHKTHHFTLTILTNTPSSQTTPLHTHLPHKHLAYPHKTHHFTLTFLTNHPIPYRGKIGEGFNLANCQICWGNRQIKTSPIFKLTA